MTRTGSDGRRQLRPLSPRNGAPVWAQLDTLGRVDGLGYACALLLAAVFVRGGAAKLARPQVTATGFAALGVPAAVVLAGAVPVIELLVAVALVAAPRAGAVAALVVLAAFSAVLGRALRAGADAPCACFGTARTDPVSTTDLVRNGLLVVAAAAALTAARPASPSPGAVVAAAVSFAAGLALLATLRRRTAA